MKSQRRAILAAQPGLIGRGPELDALRATTRGATALIGPQGIGKSRLLGFACTLAKQRGAQVLRATGAARSPLTELLGARSTDFVLTLADERLRRHDRMARIVAERCQGGGLLLALDDMQDAGRELWAELGAIVRGNRDAPVWLVLALHDWDEVLVDLEQLGRDIPIQRLVLGPLGLADISELVTELAGDPVVPQVAQWVLSESEGNPWFARQLFAHAMETGALEHRDHRWTFARSARPRGVPAGLHEMATAQVKRLPEAARDALRRASVFEHGFTLAELGQVSGLHGDALLHVVDEGVAHDVLVPTETGYALSHALTHRALANELNPDVASQLHRTLAEQTTDDAKAARHYFLSSRLPGSQAGLPRALRAAAAAARRYEWESESFNLQLAYHWERTSEVLAYLAMARAAEMYLEGAYAAATHLPLDASFIAAFARRMKSAGAPAKLWEPLVLEALEHTSPAGLTWARLETVRTRWRCRWRYAAVELEELPPHRLALELIAREGNADDVASALDVFTHRTADETRALEKTVAKWKGAAARIHVHDVIARDWLYRHGDLPRAVQRLVLLRDDAEKYGSLPGEAEAYTQLSLVHAVLGDRRASDDALASARDLVVRLGSDHRLHGVVDIALATVRTHLYGGDWAPIDAKVSAVLQRVELLATPSGISLLSFGALSAAHLDAATYRRRMDSLLRSLEQADLRGYMVCGALTAAVFAAWVKRDVRPARRLRKLVLAAQRRGLDTGAFSGAHALLLGRLAALEDDRRAAKRHFLAAREVLEQNGQRCLRALLASDEAWLGTGTFDEANGLLATAGMPPLAAAAAPQNPRAHTADGLSPREREVLRQLAKGSSAKEIASALHLSTATVQRHTANLYAKLGIGTRAAAIAYARLHNEYTIDPVAKTTR